MPANRKNKPQGKEKSLKLADRVGALVVEQGMILPGEKVLLALSGGADSTCLFHLLAILRGRIGFEMTAAHLDHGMRPESPRDSEFCRRLCAASRVEIVIGRAALGPGAAEAAARRARYDFLGRTACESGCRVIATAHNLDDQAETILLRVIRGTGLQGLSGISPVRPFRHGACEMRLVRPLLETGRREIEEWLSGGGWDFVTDRTNFELDYLRNRLRRELMPRLLDYNPSLPRTLARMAETVAHDYSFIALEGEKALEKHRLSGSGPEAAGPQPDCFLFRRDEFRRLHVSIQREMLRQAMSGPRTGGYRPRFEQVEKARVFILRGRAAVLEPAPGSRIERKGRDFRLGREVRMT